MQPILKLSPPDPLSRKWKVIRSAAGGLAVVNQPDPSRPVLFTSHAPDPCFAWIEKYTARRERRRTVFQVAVLLAVLFLVSWLIPEVSP